MDKDDIEMIFRCLMQLCRHFAKKHGFRIKAYEPEGRTIESVGRQVSDVQATSSPAISA